MRRATIIRAVIAVVIGCVAVAGRWVWTMPLAHIPSTAVIGRLNLEQPGAKLRVSFVPPKQLSSITLAFPRPMPGSEAFSAHPVFPLSVRVCLAEAGRTNLIDELITKDRMQWTSWHSDPSLLLMLQGWLGESLNRNHEYELTVTVDSPVAGIGQADVFLHWMDGAYVWGREQQKLKLTAKGVLLRSQ